MGTQPDKCVIPDTENYKDESMAKRSFRRSRLRPSNRELVKELRFADSDGISHFNRSDAMSNSEDHSK